MVLSVNRNAMPLVKELMEDPEALGVRFERTGLGATVIDAGIEARAGYRAGELITEICMGGYADAHVSAMPYGELSLPSIFVSTGYPAVATLGSQFAGWRIKVGDFYGMGSGPARALAQEPQALYEKVGYRDSSDVAVLLLEVDKKPSDDVVKFVAGKTGVKPDGLYIILTPTNSLAGSIQISGRVVETGVHKLTELGLDPRRIIYGCGYAPLAPIHPKSARAMGRTNDVILYGGVTYYTVDYEDEEALADIVSRTPSSTSRDYGRLFHEIFKAANYDFYKIDPHLFAPATVTVNNVKTGKTWTAGRVNIDILKRSMDLTQAGRGVS